MNTATTIACQVCNVPLGPGPVCPQCAWDLRDVTLLQPHEVEARHERLLEARLRWRVYGAYDQDASSPLQAYGPDNNLDGEAIGGALL